MATKSPKAVPAQPVFRCREGRDEADLRSLAAHLRFLGQPHQDVETHGTVVRVYASTEDWLRDQLPRPK